jgi:hypothetical protein
MPGREGRGTPSHCCLRCQTTKDGDNGQRLKRIVSGLFFSKWVAIFYARETKSWFMPDGINVCMSQVSCQSVVGRNQCFKYQRSSGISSVSARPCLVLCCRRNEEEIRRSLQAFGAGFSLPWPHRYVAVFRNLYKSVYRRLRVSAEACAAGVKVGKSASPAFREEDGQMVE